MSTEREHAHDRKHDDDHRDHDDRSVGRLNRSALLNAPEHPVTSGLIARKAARDDNGVETGAEQAIATASSSSGMSLPSPIMRKFEASLGADLSGVRVHTGAESQAASGAVGAKAYTMGQDIHFGAGQYDPSSGAGEHLLAHEVAHTVQQRGRTPTRQNKLEVSTPFDPAEHEADTAANAMVSGERFQVGTGSGVQRKGYADEGATEAHSTVSPSYHFTLPLPESKKFPLGVVDVRFGGSVSGSVSKAEPEGEDDDEASANTHDVEIGPTNSTKDGLGFEEEIELVKATFAKGDSWSVTSKPALEIEANAKKVGLAISGVLKFATKGESWLHVVSDAAVRAFEVDYEEFKKTKWKSVEGPGVVVTLSLSGEKTFGDTTMAVSSSGTATISPNWTEIEKRVGKKLAEEGLTDASEGVADESATESATESAGEATTGTAEGTTGAVTEGAATTEGATATAATAGDDIAIGVDLGASAGVLAALILPAGVAIIAAIGSKQDADNEDAKTAAMHSGQAMFGQLVQYVGGYELVLKGQITGDSGGAGPGAEEAEKQVAACMAATGKSRDDARAALVEHAGGFERMSSDLFAQTRDRLFQQGCAEFEDKWKDRMGATEAIGKFFDSNMGMRSSFIDEFHDQMFRYWGPG